MKRPLAFLSALCLCLALLMPSQAVAQSADDTVRAVGEMLQGVMGNSDDAAAEPEEEPGNADGEAQEATDSSNVPAAQVPSADAPPVPGRLYARLTPEEGALGSGVRWRVYSAKPEADGSYRTIAASDEPQPVISVVPGEYVAVAVFGHAVASRKLTVDNTPFREAVTLNAGGLRLTSVKADGTSLSARAVKLAVYSAEQDEFGQRKLIVDNAQPGRVIVLNAGSYHVVSQYGDANSSVQDNVKVEPAQLTDARISHNAAQITFKLVNETGGEALANTSWSIRSPEGDVIKESFGAFPTHILAAGDYSVIARHEERIFNREFSVAPGLSQEVEVVAQ